MYKFIMIVFAAALLACGGSDNPASPSVPDNSEDPGSDNPLVANWSVSELTVDNMVLGSPDASGSVVITSSTISVSVDALGQPLIREFGNYTNTTSEISVFVESTGETKTWGFTVDETTLKLSGIRSADGENLSLKMTCYK